MKKLAVAFLVLAVFRAYAQEETLITVDAKKVSETETPVNVIEAVREDFPDGEALDYYLYTAKQVVSEWAVSVDDNIQENDDVDHYTVLLKGKNGGYIYSLYNKDGDLLMTKILARGFALPSAIRTAATTGKYEGYQIQSDKYFKLVNRRRNKEYLEVTVYKGRDTKKLYFTPEGELIKEK